MTTVEAVKRQLDAMQQRKYEVGLFLPDGSGSMIPRIWSAESLEQSIGWMRHQNAHGRNIYIRPAGEHNMSLIDDLKASVIQEMNAKGFKPALVVETSPGNFQAWLKHDRTLEKELSTYVSRKLSQQFDGDMSSADWRHFGRLAGFTNRKPKYQQPDGFYPYVKLSNSGGQVYERSQEFIGAASVEWLQVLAQRIAQKQRYASENQGLPIKDIEKFRNDPRYRGDMHVADVAYAVYAASRGLSDEDIARAIYTRDLSHKGPPIRQDAYVERTISKARGRSLGR